MASYLDEVNKALELYQALADGKELSVTCHKYGDVSVGTPVLPIDFENYSYEVYKEPEVRWIVERSLYTTYFTEESKARSFLSKVPTSSDNGAKLFKAIEVRYEQE